jgi:uridine kinase
MVTIIRDNTTCRQDFIFFVDRLATLLVENALGVLPYFPKSIVTPVNAEYQGKELDASVSRVDVPLISFDT